MPFKVWLFKIKIMKMSIIISLSIAILLSNCQKEIITPIPTPTPICIYNCDTPHFEIVWQRPLSFDTTEWASQKPTIFGEGVLFTKKMYNENHDTLKFYNSQTGNLKWKWTDFLHDDKGFSISTKNMFEKGGKFLFTTWHEVYSVNATNGTTNWRYEVPTREGHPRMNIIGKDIYHIHLDRHSGITYNSYLVKSNIDVMKWDTIHVQPMINNFEPIHEMPTAWINPQGDTILIFQIRYVDFKNIIGTGNRTDIIAYNVTQKKEYFRFNNIDRFGTGSTQPPYVLNDKAYVPLARDIICFNMLTKSIQWQKDFSANFTSGIPFIFVENKFFIKPDNRALYQIDPETGSELWVDRDNGSSCSDMIYHDGLLYYACNGNGKLYAIEVATGKKIWAERSPNQFVNKFNGFKARSNANIGDSGVAINAELGYIYVSDFYFAMCLKLFKR